MGDTHTDVLDIYFKFTSEGERGMDDGKGEYKGVTVYLTHSYIYLLDIYSKFCYNPSSNVEGEGGSQEEAGRY